MNNGIYEKVKQKKTKKMLMLGIYLLSSPIESTKANHQRVYILNLFLLVASSSSSVAAAAAGNK